MLKRRVDSEASEEQEWEQERKGRAGPQIPEFKLRAGHHRNNSATTNFRWTEIQHLTPEFKHLVETVDIIGITSNCSLCLIKFWYHSHFILFKVISSYYVRPPRMACALPKTRSGLSRHQPQG